MAVLDPANTSVNDVCSAALYEGGIVGVGQTPSGGQLADTQARLQWMLQEWERKRWLVFHLVTLSMVTTGAISYTCGPGGDFDTGPGSVRPAKLESAFLRQLVNSQPNQVDFPLEILQSMEDYNRIALKGLSSFPGTVFMDPTWPLATVYPWPVPQASIYSTNITILAQLPQSFLTSAVKFNIPYEYYAAILYNLAIRCRARWQIGSFAGDELPNLAKQSLKTLRGANTAIARLTLPDMNRTFIYNIFSDRYY